jgi:FPC/CPF motif-containing protein YcgG
VAREHEQLEGRHRQIDVDRDPAAEIAEVAAERPPRLVPDDLHDDSLAGRELDQAVRPRTRDVDDRSHSELD